MSDHNTDKLPTEEKRDFDFWKEYFYWAWRSVLFVLFIVIATNLDFRGDQILSFDHVSRIEWAVVLLLGLLSPAIFVGWSLFWAWWQHLFGRLRG